MLSTNNFNLENCLAKLDFTGYESFKNIMYSLVSGEDISSEQWDAFFSIPGYNALISGNFTREFLSDKFVLAFHPGKKQELREIQNNLEAHPSYNCFLGHYVTIQENWKEVEKKIHHFQENCSLLIEKAFELAFTYLPEMNLETIPYPDIDFLILGMDGMSSERIVLDIYALVDVSEEYAIRFIAHELHHYYRNYLLEFEISSIPKESLLFIYLLNRIHSEGTANQTDKNMVFGETARDYLQKRKEWFFSMVKKSPEIIHQINNFTDNFIQNNETLPELAENIRKILPMSGNPFGYFMYQEIEKSYSLPEIYKIIGNPFEFFLYYQESTKKTSSPKFSENFINLIQQKMKETIKQ